jgi:AcrR family transcriptional regulator
MTATAETLRDRPRNPRGEGARLRDEIIAAATELIEASGDSTQVTLRGVAKKVGIAAPSIYQHFDGTEELKLAVVERMFRQFASKRHVEREGIDDPEEALLSGCQMYCRFALEHPGAYRFMFSHESPADGRQSATGAAAISRLTESIRRCQKSGRASVLTDPRALAAYVWASLHGLALLHINTPNFYWPANLEEMTTVTVTRLVGLTGSPRSGTGDRPRKENT